VVRLELESQVGARIAFPFFGVASQVAISPDGGRIVYAGSASGSGWSLYLRNLDQLAGRPLAGTEGAYNPEFSPDGQWIAFRAADGKLKKIATDGSGLTTITPIDNYGSVGGGITWTSNREIVFARGTYSEGRGLWRVSADGGEPVQFAQLDSASGERLQLSPRAADQGRLVFYSSTVAGNADHRIGVISMATGKPTLFPELRGARAVGLIDGSLLYVRLDGALMAVPFDAGSLRVGEPIQVADSIAIPPSAWTSPIALSSSGSLIYQKGGIAAELVTVSRGETRVLLDSVQMYLHPRLSPDGNRIAVEIQTATGADIWITDLRERTTERLTREGFNNRPEWTPDGARVLYTSSREPSDALWLQPADGSGSGTVVVQDSNPIREGVITPDGQSVVYRVDTRATNRDIYRAPLDGGKSIPVLNGINDDKQPRISPDGKWLAYVSNESGREEVYVRALSGGGGRVPVSTGGGGEPLWAENGRRLFYRSQSRVMAATIATQPSLQVTGRELVFEGQFASDLWHPNYDVTGDGQTFIMVRPVEENRQLVMVVNWIEELRRRTRGGR
jgi:serine/threonine-protein kinase